MVTLEKQIMDDVNHRENYSRIERGFRVIPTHQFIKVNVSKAGEFIVSPTIQIVSAVSLDRDVVVTRVVDNVIHIKAFKSTDKAVIFASNDINAIQDKVAEYA